MICAVVAALKQSGTMLSDRKGKLVVPIWKEKGDPQNCNNHSSVALMNSPSLAKAAETQAVPLPLPLSPVRQTFPKKAKFIAVGKEHQVSFCY